MKLEYYFEAVSSSILCIIYFDTPTLTKSWGVKAVTSGFLPAIVELVVLVVAVHRFTISHFTISNFFVRFAREKMFSPPSKPYYPRVCYSCTFRIIMVPKNILPLPTPPVFLVTLRLVRLTNCIMLLLSSEMHWRQFMPAELINLPD